MAKEVSYHSLSKPAYTTAVELNWKGKNTPSSISKYPARCLEEYGSKDQHVLLWGDNFHALGYLLDNYREKIDLIYLDPPFDSQANYDRIVRLRGTKSKSQLRLMQYCDQWSPSQYLQFIYERVLVLRDLLSENGSIYMHADWHRISHLKLIMDEVFGEENLLNEIIWHHDFGGRSPYFLARKHDNLLLYKKGKNWTFNQASLPDIAYQGNLHTYRGKPKKGKKPTAVWHDQTSDHDFVWDIAYENKMAKQNTGYPTQKPLALLHRIIRLSSNEGDLILDPFLGSGSTALAAMQCNRRFIGIDDNWDSIHTTRTRLHHKTPSLSCSIWTTNQCTSFRSPSEAKERYPTIIQPNNIVETRDIIGLDMGKRETVSGHQFHQAALDWLKENHPKVSVKLLDIQNTNDMQVSWFAEDNWLEITAVSSLEIEKKFPDATHWKNFIQSVVVDFNYQGAQLQNPILDCPLDRSKLISGRYQVPEEHGDILLVVTDILCRSLRVLIPKEKLWKK